jgi:uncharacterized Zn-finger protein
VEDEKNVDMNDASAAKKKQKRKPAKKYACTEPRCGKMFTSPAAVVIHFRTHTGEKPYACSEPGCGKAFAQTGTLTVHKRTHPGEKSYMCVLNRAAERRLLTQAI